MREKDPATPLQRTPAVGEDEALEILVIDLAQLLGSRPQQSKGFFQLINHKVYDEITERMKLDIEGYFKLPLEEKRQVAQVPGNLEGYGQLFVVSEEQKLDSADILYLITSPVPQRSLRFWPTSPPTFRLEFN